MQQVLLLTVTREDSTAPIAHGIYVNLAQAIQGLHAVNMHPGFSCTQKTLHNKDGSWAGALFANGQYVATIAPMGLRMAAAIARGDSVWDVPDTLEALNA